MFIGFEAATVECQLSFQRRITRWEKRSFKLPKCCGKDWGERAGKSAFSRLVQIPTATPMGCYLTRLWRCKLPVVKRHGRLKILYLQALFELSGSSDFYCQFCREDLNLAYESCISSMSEAMKDASTVNDLLKNSSLYREFQAEREEILRHKWIESEKAGHDIGFERALTDWIINHRSSWRKTRQVAGH
jgi:hypothetical protein